LEPIPRAHLSVVAGLLEILEDYEGKVDAAKIADELMLELDDILPAIEAAEMLGFIKVDAGDLILTDKGREYLAGNSMQRKKTLNQALSKIDLFKWIIEQLKSRGNEMSKEELIRLLEEEMPDVDAAKMVKWIIEWGRHALILRYDSNSETIKLGELANNQR
jgi:NitT/TauT family transport system ATP-binding protein